MNPVAIKNAFPPHPLDPTTPDDAWADTCLDVVAFRSGLMGRRWDELDPAFLVTVLQHEERLDMLPAFLLSALTPPTDLPSRQPLYAANLASLTPDQQRVVLRALGYLAREGRSDDVRVAARAAQAGFRSSVGLD